MAKHIETFKGWAETIVGDVAALEALVGHEKADADARKLAAGALGYLITRLDLVPDSQDIGGLDDLMVLRVCAQMAINHDLGGLSSDAEFSISRMANESDEILKFLGSGPYDKLRAHCAQLADTVVRGRAPATIVTDDKAAARLFEEVDVEIKRRGPVVIKDAADAELRLKAYLMHKLK